MRTSQPHAIPPDPSGSVNPRPRDQEIDVFGLTHPGAVRRLNQDHFLVCTLHRTVVVHSTSLPNPELLEVPGERLAFLGMVADGVGGTDGGEEASRAALEAIATYAAHTMRCYQEAIEVDHTELLDSLQRAAQASHDRVCAIGRERPELAGLATTLTLAFSIWPSLFLLQIGDSRAYRLRDGRLERLTRDQTVAQELVDDGVLRESAAHQSPFAHVLSSAIGSRAAPVVTRHESQRRDVILMCTDGLTKHVPDERLRERLLGMTSAEDACRALLDDALAGGGTDNITILVGRVKPVADTAPAV